MKKDIFKVLLCYVALYTILFLVIPFCEYAAGSDGRVGSTAAFIVIIVITVVGMRKLSDKLRYWLIGSVLYLLLIRLYHPIGIFGIGIISPDGMQPFYDASLASYGIGYHTSRLLRFQFMIWGIIKISRFFTARSKKQTTLGA